MSTHIASRLTRQLSGIAARSHMTLVWLATGNCLSAYVIDLEYEYCTCWSLKLCR